MEEVFLAAPSMEYADEIRAFREEILMYDNDISDRFAGCFHMEKCSYPEKWIEICDKLRDPAKCREFGVIVPSHEYLLVHDADRRILGIIDIREHIDHPILREYGGHMGYTIRPTERGKGYGKEMLRLALEKARDMSIRRVLVTCDADNHSSEAVILANGGLLHDQIDVDGTPVKRYWIDIKGKMNAKNIVIRRLDLSTAPDFFDFFDNRAFSDGSPNAPCYCNLWHISSDEITELIRKAATADKGDDNWKETLRASAMDMIEKGILKGYLAYEGDIAIGWCNSNDRISYNRVGEFYISETPSEDLPAEEGLRKGVIKSVVCFEVSPDFRGRGIASMLLERVTEDAMAEGYQYIEAYPNATVQDTFSAFTGPKRLYDKAGFIETGRKDHMVIMRKSLL
ncbi:MAG: GNAT family N-acetyltransferase [Clostridia bacterium]|nr:GNAT family N-acetyltransferase [Clostridia bacterium]